MPKCIPKCFRNALNINLTAVEPQVIDTIDMDDIPLTDYTACVHVQSVTFEDYVNIY